MKILLVFALACFPFFARTEVSFGDVSQMLDQMVKEGTISEAEAAKAKLKMSGMSSEQWSTLNKHASTVAAKQARYPASVKDIGGGANDNLDGAQFQQIKDDVKKMGPQFQDQE